ncbi:MAG: Fe-S cluster assembly ATPase SufC [Deltaproteobacteria bacterium]|nr:Fe-S cluster assembly ATPase SufC [Deltaproteobacteria bacterium]
MLELTDLRAKIAGKEILTGVDLAIRPGEVHAVMGPNGSGKSTLSKVIAGHPSYEVTGGDIRFNGVSILDAPPEERARAGIFLSFQYPVEIAGVPTSVFLKSALNAVRKHRGQGPLDAMDFLTAAKSKMKLVGMPEALLHRALNEGFSGGEKKRNEIFQLAMMEPSLAILDEMDSGLDIDALRTIAEGVTALRNPQRSMLVITHYQRLLDHLVPDVTHVFAGGRIVRSGDADLAREVEARGYAWVTA